jgi:hypothetical protein
VSLEFILKLVPDSRIHELEFLLCLVKRHT